jgi:hypothetical protein
MTHLFDLAMQRLKDRKHGIHIMIRKVMLGSFFQRFMPLFVPKNSRSNQFCRDQLGLIYDSCTMLAHLGSDIVRQIPSTRDVGLLGNGDRIYECLGMGLADIV